MTQFFSINNSDQLLVITPQICRVIETLIKYYEDYVEYIHNESYVFQLPIYAENEKPTTKAEVFTAGFLEYMVSKEMIEIIDVEDCDYYCQEINETITYTPWIKVKILDIDLIKETWQQLNKEKNNKITNQKSSSIEFRDYKLTYKDITHKFNRKTDLPRYELFKNLWNRKQVIKKGKTVTQGEILPAAAVAVQIGLVDFAHEYENQRDIQKKLSDMIDDLEKVLRKKGFPIVIENYLMTIEM